MMNNFAKIVLTLCATLVVCTAFAKKGERMTVREKVEAGKKVSIHKIIKSEDPSLIYSEGLKYYGREKWMTFVAVSMFCKSAIGISR